MSVDNREIDYKTAACSADRLRNRQQHCCHLWVQHSAQHWRMLYTIGSKAAMVLFFGIFKDPLLKKPLGAAVAWLTIKQGACYFKAVAWPTNKHGPC
jgi:hypothetical protein